MDHDIRCIFDDIDPNDTDALSLFLTDLEDEPAQSEDAATKVDDFQSILNGDDKSEVFPSPASGDGGDGSASFCSPQHPPPAPTQHTSQPGPRTNSLQQNMVAASSPRTAQQPTTPGSVVDSPYSQQHPATPSPASNQLTCPSPLTNTFQQPQKQPDVKISTSSVVPLHNSQSKSQVQAPSPLQEQHLQILNQQQLLKNQQLSGSCLNQTVSQATPGQQTNMSTVPVQVQLQNTQSVNGQHMQQIGSARIQQQQVQGTVIQTSLGNQVFFQGGLPGQVQLQQQVGISQQAQLVTSQGSVVQPGQQPVVTIAASSIQPPSLQVPPNISIMSLQGQIQPQHQHQQLVLQGSADNQHNVILTTLPGSSMMQLAGSTSQQNAIPAGMVIGQNQTQVVLTKDGHKVHGQVLLQSQPGVSSQLQLAGLKQAGLIPNTLTIQNQQGPIINLQQSAQHGTVVQNIGARVEASQTPVQNVQQQRHLIQVNGQTIALTTQQLQQLINLQQKKQLIQQPAIQQQPGVQGQTEVQLLQQSGGGLQVITANSSSPSAIPKPVPSSTSQPTLATQAAVQQNLQEIRDKMLKQTAQQQTVITELSAVSQNSAIGSTSGIPGIASASSQSSVLGATQAAVAALTQTGTLTVLGAAGQPQPNRAVNVVGQGQVLTQAIVQHPAQGSVLQLQPNPSQTPVVSKGNLVTVQAIAVQGLNQQQTKQQVTHFRQILPSTSQILSTASSGPTLVSASSAVSNFTSLLPSATSKPSIVAPNVNIQTLGLGNQVNSLVLQQQLQQQLKERQQQKAAPRLLPGHPPSNSSMPSGQINASLALQQLNVAQQQRNASSTQENKSATDQQHVQISALPQAAGTASQQLVTTTSLSTDTLANAAFTVSAHSPHVTSPLISSSSTNAQGILSTTQQKPADVRQTNVGGPAPAVIQVPASTPVLLGAVTSATSTPAGDVNNQAVQGGQIQGTVLSSASVAVPGQGQGGTVRVPSIQLTPQLQQALATVQQKMKTYLAIPNRTEAQNASLQQLIVWQQKILLIGRTQAMKAQQGQLQQQTSGGIVQNVVPTPVQIQQTSQQHQPVAVQRPVTIAHQATVTSASSGVPVQVQELLTSAASSSAELTTTFATNTVVSPSAPNIATGGMATSSQDTKVITNINQLPPDMKEKLRLQLAKLNPAQLDYFLKNQVYVLTKLIKHQQEMQKQRQEQAAQLAAAGVVKAAANQKQVIQQLGSGGITIVTVSEAPVAQATSVPAASVAVVSSALPSATVTRGVPAKVPVKMSRKQLFSHYITKDQKKVEQPDYKEPFKNNKDILKQLLAYHVCQVKQDKRHYVEQGAAAYEEAAQELLAKKDEMFKKYQYLILEESMRPDRTAEMVMLERMFLASEKEVLAEDKRQAEEDPENFVPVPCMSMSGDEDESNSSVTSPSTPPVDARVDGMTASNPKHSSDSPTDEQHSPGGNYTLRASTGLRLVFKTSPVHTNVSSPTPLTESFSVKSEDSGISSQQNSVETDEDGAPPRKKMCVSVSDDKEHYRTSNGVRPSMPGRVPEKTMAAEEPDLPFQTYREEPVRQGICEEGKTNREDGVGEQSGVQLGIADLDGLNTSEADSAVAGLLSSSDFLSQDLGAYSEDLFGELTLEHNISRGLPNNFMEESDKESALGPQQDEAADYDTDVTAGDQEHDTKLQNAIGGLLSDIELDGCSDDSKQPYLS